MNVWGYARVSCSRQVEEGVSLDEQQRQLEGRAIERGWSFTKIFIEEGVSGGVPLRERPQGKALLAAARPGDIIVATKLDRMFRSALDALTVIEDLRARQISLWLLDMGGDVSGNGIAQMMVTILSAVAQFERYRIGERVRDAKRHQREAGRYLGGNVAFGWRRGAGDILVEEPVEQGNLRFMRELRAQGWSYTKIGRRFEPAIDGSLIRRYLARDGQKD